MNKSFAYKYTKNYSLLSLLIIYYCLLSYYSRKKFLLHDLKDLKHGPENKMNSFFFFKARN